MTLGKGRMFVNLDLDGRILGANRCLGFHLSGWCSGQQVEQG